MHTGITRISMPVWAFLWIPQVPVRTRSRHLLTSLRGLINYNDSLSDSDSDDELLPCFGSDDSVSDDELLPCVESPILSESDRSESDSDGFSDGPDAVVSSSKFGSDLFNGASMRLASLEAIGSVDMRGVDLRRSCWNIFGGKIPEAIGSVDMRGVDLRRSCRNIFGCKINGHNFRLYQTRQCADSTVSHP